MDDSNLCINCKNCRKVKDIEMGHPVMVNWCELFKKFVDSEADKNCEDFIKED